LGFRVPLKFSTCLRAPTVVASPVHEASTQHCGIFLPGVKLSTSTFSICWGTNSTVNIWHQEAVSIGIEQKLAQTDHIRTS